MKTKLALFSLIMALAGTGLCQPGLLQFTVQLTSQSVSLGAKAAFSFRAVRLSQ